MTKETIIDAVLNSKILEMYDKQGAQIFQTVIPEETISVCSKGIIVIYDGENMSYIDSLIPFEEVAKIVISKKIVLE